MPTPKSVVLALVLWLFLGGLGIHRFYLNRRHALTILLLTLAALSSPRSASASCSSSPSSSGSSSTSSESRVGSASTMPSSPMADLRLPRDLYERIVPPEHLDLYDRYDTGAL